MRARALALIFFLLVSCTAPALAATDERYGYITVEKVEIRLENETALIHMNYTVDESTRFLFFLLGKQDLKKKLLKILNYEEAQTKYIDLSSADFILANASEEQADGVYWFPAHTFNVLIPSLSVQSPQKNRQFSNTTQFPEGMGFFTEP